MSLSPLTATAGLSETSPSHGTVSSRWIRFAQAVQWYPWGRAKLYDLIREGQIKSFVLMEPGASRGLRLVDRYSMDEFLQSAAERAAKELPVKHGDTSHTGCEILFQRVI